MAVTLTSVYKASGAITNECMERLLKGAVDVQVSRAPEVVWLSRVPAKGDPLPFLRSS